MNVKYLSLKLVETWNIREVIQLFYPAEPISCVVVACPYNFHVVKARFTGSNRLRAYSPIFRDNPKQGHFEH